MKLSLSHLSQWLTYDDQQIADTLTMLGHEVDDVIQFTVDFTGVVVGHVLEKLPHPNADKLSICKVDIGHDSPLQIVCGAKNVASGQKVPVAQVSARLPGDFTIKKAKLRGEKSEGMICASRELGVDFPHDEGIWVLSDDAPVGETLENYLHINDTVLDIALTPNRADCFSVLGLARDLAAKESLTLENPLDFTLSPTNEIKQTLELQSKQMLGLVMTQFMIRDFSQTPTPIALLLHRQGYTLLNPVCDAIHYVMHSIGQPMHAYDFNKLDANSPIAIGRPTSNLNFEGLNGETYALEDEDIVVKQNTKTLSLAGIMGGDDSKTMYETRSVLLEAAYFTPESIARTSRRLKLSTDASVRFERGVDPDISLHASNAVVNCLSAWGVIEGEVQQSHTFSGVKKNDAVIAFQPSSFTRRMGYSLDSTTIQRFLSSLGCDLDHHDDVMSVKAPSWRYDLNIEADIIEELARMNGYEIIPVSRLNARSLQPSDNIISHLESMLVAMGFHQAYTSSLVSMHQHGDSITPVSLRNPLAEPLSCLRSDLFTGLLTSLDYNFARSCASLSLFEIGTVYHHDASKIVNRKILSGVFYGDSPIHWQNTGYESNFYQLKGIVFHLLSSITDISTVELKRSGSVHFHPGQSCDIYLNHVLVASLGRRHPKLLSAKKSAKNAYMFEINLDDLASLSFKKLEKVSAYPSVQRDLCFWLNHKLEFGLIQQCIKKTASSILSDVILFDIYKSKDEPDLISYTLRLVFESKEETLEDQVVQQEISNITDSLEEMYNIIMR